MNVFCTTLSTDHHLLRPLTSATLRHRNNRSPTLRLLRPNAQNRPLSTRRMYRQIAPRRYPRLFGQPQSPHRARQIPRRVLPLRHYRTPEVAQCAHRKPRVRARELLPIIRELHHGPLSPELGGYRTRFQESGI